MEGGDLQVLRHNVPPADIEALQAKGFNVLRYPAYDGQVLWFNNSKDPFTDQRAREAIARSIDYEAVESVLLRGYGTRSQSFFPRIFEGYKEGLQPTEKDLTKAKQLFSAAGVEGVTIEYRYSEGFASFARPVGEQLQSELAKFDIKLDIQQLPGPVLTESNREPNTTPNMQFGTNGADALSSFTLAFPWIHSKGPLNRHWSTHSDVDALIEKAYSEMDTPTRAALYEEVAKLLGERATALQMWEVDPVVIYDKRLTGIKIHPGYFRSFNWYNAQWTG
jgi:peptide/nickel transport system substrate-binding protein